MKTHQLALTLILVAVAGCSGYYLGAAKEQPVSELTADRVLELTDDALQIGKAVDREAEVTAATRWMLRIPRNGQHKTRIEHAATDQCPQPSLARS